MQTTDGGFMVSNDVTTNSKGGKEIRVALWEGSSPPKAGSWTLELQRQASATSGLFDAWICDWVFGSGGVPPVFTSNVNYTELVMSPATADSVISVGAYTTKTEWTNVSGSGSMYPELPQPNDIAFFSSPGPRRDGVQRPDLAAPGQGIASSLSSASGVANMFRVEDGVHWVYRGTSAAAAHVVGAVALLLQQSPHMTPAAARRALIQRAQRDNYTGTVPNATWGSGKLDLISSTAGVDELTPGTFALSSVHPNPTRGGAVFSLTISAEAVRNGERPVLRVLDVNGREVALLHGRSAVGRQQVVWNGLTSGGRTAAAGIYLGRLEMGSRWAARKFVRLQ